MEYRIYHNVSEIKISLGSGFGGKDLYELWQLCFGDTDSYTDFYFDWKVKENQIVSIYKGDRISSMLHLNPYLLRVQGRPVQANYIVGVATRPEERRKGLMGQLLVQSFQEMYEKQMEFTYLMPAAEGIYLPYDFRIVYEQEPWNKALVEDQNRLSGASSAQIYELKVTDAKNIEDLVSFCNEILSSTYDIYVERNPYYFTRLLHEMYSCEGGILLCYEADRLIGYASYMAEEKVYVTEMIYLPSKKAEVYHSISEFFHNVIGKEIYLRKADSQIPAIMARIVNWNSFIKYVKASEDMELIIKVSDPVITQNNGIYSLLFTKEGCISKVTNKAPEIEADTAQLTRLFFDKMSRTELLEIINGTKQESILAKIDKIKKYQKVFINDVV
ncbi:MAG: hypothetical protein K0R92_1960 [Lachnospiraceae bacterium]|jgi:predicted acetyltransferase|nr:hypothetical protein [Lachnospiraceae bacterium]